MKEYVVAFGDWFIEAENEEEAEEKAKKMLEEGEYPPIHLIEEN